MAGKEKPGCSFCPGQGHSWVLPEGKRACFNCLRTQRNTYRDEVQRLTEEVAALQETHPVREVPLWTNRADQLWSSIFSHLFEVRDDDWPTQASRLREIARLALALVDVIEGVEAESGTPS